MNEQEENALRDLAITRYKKIHEQPVSDALVNGILRGGLAGGITGATLASVPATITMINHDSYKNQEFNAKNHAKCVLLSALLGGAGGSLVGGLIGGSSAIAKKENAAYQLSKLMPKTAAAKDYLIGGLAGAGIGAGGGMLANFALGKKLFSAPMLLTGAGVGGALGLAVGHQQAKFRSAENVSNYVRPAMIRKDADGRALYYVRTNDGNRKPEDDPCKALEYGKDGKMYLDGSVYQVNTAGEGQKPDMKDVHWDKESNTLFTLSKDKDGNVHKSPVNSAYKRYNQGMYVVSTREVPISEALGMKNEKINDAVPGFRNIFTHAACVAVSDKPFNIKTPDPNGDGYVLRHARRGKNGQYFMEFGLSAYPDKERIKYTGFKKMLMPKHTYPYISGYELVHLYGDKGFDEKQVSPGDNNPYAEDLYGSAGWNALTSITNYENNPALQVMSLTDPSMDMNQKTFSHILDKLSNHISKHPEGYGPYNVAAPPYNKLLAEGNPYSNCHEWIVGWLHDLVKDKTLPNKSMPWIADNPFPALAGNYRTSERGWNTYFKGDEG